MSDATSEPPADPPAAASTPATVVTPPPAPDAEDWKAKYESTLAESRKWEDRAKKALPAVKELDELKKNGMSDIERATAEAKAAGAAEARQMFGARLVDAEVKAAAAGRAPEVVAALLEGLDRTKFLTDDGEPDVKAIGKWVERAAPPPAAAGAAPLDLGQGARPGAGKAPDMNDRLRTDLFGHRR